MNRLTNALFWGCFLIALAVCCLKDKAIELFVVMCFYALIAVCSAWCWVTGLNHEPERAIVADIEVIVKVLPKGRKGRPCATYKQSWAVGTTKGQIESFAVNK